MKKAETVPVVLFAFNRPAQLAKTLSCLKINRIPLLYVFADGPRDRTDDLAVRQVREIIDGIDWTKVRKHYSPANKGLSRSIQEGLDAVFNDYRSAIIIEDDIAVAPDFYNYMESALEFYGDNERIATVTGLRYPFDSSTLNSYRYDVFMSRRFSSWGWGTWKRYWDSVEFDNSKLAKKIDIKKIRASRAGEDMLPMIKQLLSGQVSGGWDINCAMAVLDNDQFVVCPTKNRVMNNGLTEGTHASGPAPFWRLRWEIARQPQAYSFLKSPHEDQKISAAFLDFFRLHLHPEDLPGYHSRLMHRRLSLSDRLRIKLRIT